MANRFTGPEYPQYREYTCEVCKKRFKRYEEHYQKTRRLKLCSKECKQERRRMIDEGMVKASTRKDQSKAHRDTQVNAAPELGVMAPRRSVESIPEPTKWDRKYGGL